MLRASETQLSLNSTHPQLLPCSPSFPPYCHSLQSQSLPPCTPWTISELRAQHNRLHIPLPPPMGGVILQSQSVIPSHRQHLMVSPIGLSLLDLHHSTFSTQNTLIFPTYTTSYPLSAKPSFPRSTSPVPFPLTPGSPHQLFLLTPPTQPAGPPVHKARRPNSDSPPLALS